MRVSGVSTSAPVFPDDGPRGEQSFRRVRGISLEIVAFIVVAVAPAGAAARRGGRRPGPLAQASKALGGHPADGLPLVVPLRRDARLGVDPLHLVVTGAWFGIGSKRRRVLLYRLRVHGCTSHLSGIRVLFGLRFEIEGLENGAPGPVIVMLRHASIIDNMLPDTISRTHGIGLRYVIKREL